MCNLAVLYEAVPHVLEAWKHGRMEELEKVDREDKYVRSTCIVHTM